MNDTDTLDRITHTATTRALVADNLREIIDGLQAQVRTLADENARLRTSLADMQECAARLAIRLEALA
jgi:chaperonin cofactor prefoldin